MSTPRELTERFIDAYNQRDRVAVRAMLAPVLEYVRPGGETLTSADEVMAQYERDWAMLSTSSVAVRSLLESDECIIAEITIEATMHGRSLAVEAAVAHRWREEQLVRYRLYLDPLPPEVSGRPR
jgi:ketosteroid isomerase-like protein